MASSFDRNAPKAGNGKKAALAGVLAAALAVALVRQFSHTQSSSASTADPAAGAPEETTAQALENLTNDPTRDLLRAETTEKTRFDTPPGDPFQMSPSWRTSLLKIETLKPLPEQTTVIAQVAPKPTNSNDSRPRTPTYDPTVLRLQGIFKDKARSYAIVNGSIIREGNTIAGAKVVEIADDHLVIQPLGAGEQTQFEVYLKRH